MAPMSSNTGDKIGSGREAIDGFTEETIHGLLKKFPPEKLRGVGYGQSIK